LFSSRKYPYSPHRRDWNFLGGGGSVRLKNVKKCMKLNRNFQRGGRQINSLPWGRYKNLAFQEYSRVSGSSTCPRLSQHQEIVLDINYLKPQELFYPIIVGLTNNISPWLINSEKLIHSVTIETGYSC